MDKLTYSPKEAAKAIGIALPTVYELAASKGFPAIKVGRRILIPIDALQRWLEESAKNN